MIARRMIAALMLAGGYLPNSALAATIRGHIDVHPVRLLDRRPSVYDFARPVKPATVAPERRPAVVYLETAPQKAFGGREPGKVALDQQHETFIPHVLPIIVGTTVEFLNSDVTFHNVFSFSKPKRFDLGRYPNGHSRLVRFDTPGIVRVFCEIHSHMSAYILVFSHPFFAVTDEAGRYEIAGVPPGSYVVTVWNEATPSESRPVRLSADDDVAELDFVLEDQRP